MFDLIRHVQDLSTVPATLNAACVTGSVSTSDSEASAIVSGFYNLNFEGTNDLKYNTSALENRKGYNDHATIANAIINNASAEDQDVTGLTDKTNGTCPSS